MDMSVKLNSSYAAQSTVALASQNASDASASTLLAKPVSTDSGNVSKSEDKNLFSAVKDIEAFVQSMQRNLEFSIDDSTSKVVVKVVASDTGEVIRQIPSEMALKLAQSLSDAKSVLFSENA